jgi:hypothetical protein
MPSKSERVFGERGWEQLKWVWQRIWTDNPEVVRYRMAKARMAKARIERLGESASVNDRGLLQGCSRN